MYTYMHTHALTIKNEASLEKDDRYRTSWTLVNTRSPEGVLTKVQHVRVYFSYSKCCVLLVDNKEVDSCIDRLIDREIDR